MYDVLTETMIEYRGKTYTILEGSSQKHTRLLLSSIGYSYGVKRDNVSSTLWRCTSRSVNVRCPVSIRYQRNLFVQSYAQHSFSLLDSWLKRTCDEGLHSIVRQVLALQFLSSTHIRQAVQMLKIKATTDATRTLIGNIRRQWLDNQCFQPRPGQYTARNEERR